ncbi:6a0429cd-ec3f-4fcc-bfec-0bd44765af9a [Thermothielavioides terrestris]|uniref:6a0429cd-ec3f-4fcc-bfec-0bd44765af9a n=1 Tax=Thermothielavioides terrestris TaxID=2587410 RepID=A0A446BLA0_9PEZI|nr:6a0429cd-ec3f-4fcc-bfec-0bd44765af9a [Thermothielavioides terrestris]
MEDGAYTSI